MSAQPLTRPECHESYNPCIFAMKRSDLISLCNILRDADFEGKPCPFRKINKNSYPEVMKKGEE